MTAQISDRFTRHAARDRTTRTRSPRSALARAVIATAVLVASSAPLWAESVAGQSDLRPLRKVDFDLDKLKSWGTRTFTYTIEDDGQMHELGTVTLETKVAEKRVTHHDVWKLRWKEKDIALDVEMDCAADIFMRPATIVAKGHGSGDSGTFTAKIGDEAGDVTFTDDTKKRFDLPPNTLTDMALFRVFTLLPRVEGAEFLVARLLEASELRMKGPGFIKAVGTDKINVGGKPKTMFKFTYSRGDRVIIEAWVDNAGACRQLRLDRRKTLTEKPPATTDE